MCLAPGPLVFLISLLLQTGDWEAVEKGQTGKNYSAAGVCRPPIPWPLSGQQESDHVWVYNLENSNAPALPVWTHTHTHIHTHTWERERERERERSVAVRASGLKIRKGSPEWPLAWDLKGWIRDLMRKELAEEDQRECFRQSRHLPEPGREWRKADLSHWGQAIVAGAVEGAGAWPGCQDSEGTQSAQILFCHLSSKE